MTGQAVATDATRRLDSVAEPPERGRAGEVCLKKYEELLDSLSRFQARVRDLYAREITCGAGCFSCCRTRLSVFPIEAERVRRAAAALLPAARERLSERLENDWGPLAEYCPFLVGGACSIYEARPLLCRVHGLPNGSKNYPEGAVEFCELNFEGFDIERIAPEAVLDWDQIGHLLALLNFKFADLHGRDRFGRLRIPLLEIARQALGLPVAEPIPDPGAEEGA